MTKLKDILKLIHPAQNVNINSVIDNRDWNMGRDEALDIWADKEVYSIEAKGDDLYIMVD